MLIREILPDDKENYNSSVSHITQSFEWGEFKERTGTKILRLGKFDEQRLLYGFQMTLHHVPGLNFKIGYLPRIDHLDAEILETLIKFGVENNCLFIKIEPNWLKSDTTKTEEMKKAIKDYNLKFLPVESTIPENTFQIDLTKSEEEILSGMHEKTRYNIRVSEKHGVKVKIGGSADDLSIFLNLQRQTAKRNNFSVHADSYFLTMREALKDRGMFYQLIAEIDKPEGYVTPNDQSTAALFFKKNTLPLSSIILFRFKDVLYYPYGGSTLDFKEKMANHAAHWAAIRLGKQLGCKTYDMWGCLGENPNPRDPWFGFHKFKQGFGGKLVTFEGSYDLVFHPAIYKWFNKANDLRFGLLRLKNSIGL
jgi:lipid II:glycine glycyltransferase (peptidoglycan interpeptide bridge formation enzyme)